MRRPGSRSIGAIYQNYRVIASFGLYRCRWCKKLADTSDGMKALFDHIEQEHPARWGALIGEVPAVERAGLIRLERLESCG